MTYITGTLSLNQDKENKDLYGIFDSEQDYLMCLEILNKYSTEIPNAENFIVNNVLPRIKEKFSALDVGVGNGKISKLVGDNFSKLTFVDTSLEALENLSFPSKEVVKINKSILDIDLGNSSFDFILLSHVLYYLPEKEYFLLLKKLYNQLNEHGCILIIISEGINKKEIIENFSGRHWEIESKIIQCCGFTENIEVHHELESICISNLEKFMSVVGIFLNDAGVVVNNITLKGYLQSLYKENLNTYKLEFLQKYILIMK